MITISIKNGKVSGETAGCWVDKEWSYGGKSLHTPLGKINLAAGVDLLAGQILISDDYRHVIVQTRAEWNGRRYGEFYGSHSEYTDASFVNSPAHSSRLSEIFGEMKKHLKPIK